MYFNIVGYHTGPLPKTFAYENCRKVLQYTNTIQLLHFYCFTLGISSLDSKLRYTLYFYFICFPCCYTTL